MILLSVLGHAWAAPFSLLGALVCLLTGSWPYTTRGPAVVCRAGPVIRWLFKVFAPRFNVAAYTWGAFITTFRDLEDRKFSSPAMRVDRALVRHELAHVRQAMVFGPLFPFLYLLSMLVAAVQGKRAYADCWFEVAARRAEVER